jgi:hypothetical protein
MITLKEWMEVVGYRITEGSDYQWECYGPNAHCLDSWNGDQDGHSFSVYFDTRTQEVYEVQAHDYRKQRAYRLINPNFIKKHKKEAKRRAIDFKEAWDDVEYIDLEVDDDWFQKAIAIEAEEDYDTRVEVPLTLDDEQLFQLMKLAHEQDITLNQMVENVLRLEIDRIKHEQDLQKS